MIEKMPPKRRRIYFLLAAEWTITEIAKELAIDESTVRGHAKAGLKQLNEEIGPTQEIFIDLEDGTEDGTKR